MGYYTHVTGRIQINPPAKWKEVTGSVFLPGGDWRNVQLEITETVEETEDGQLTRKTAVGIVPPSEDSFKAYDIKQHLQLLIDTLTASNADRTFTGTLDGEGEEQGDMWRLSIENGRVVETKPTISWPDS